MTLKSKNMDTSIEKNFLNRQNQFKKSITFLIASLVFFTNNIFAQGGASLDNVKKNVNAIGNEMTHEEIMQYTYMGVGFALVIAIAWFSTSLAKKRRIAADEERARRHHGNIKHTSHDPYFKSHGQGHRVRK